jgi:hypothetical protein
VVLFDEINYSGIYNSTLSNASNSDIRKVALQNANPEMVNQGYHRIITPMNNQQFPLPLQKFNGKKVFILIDPDMEKDPKVAMMLGLPELVQAPTFSVFGNENATVFSIKEYIHYNDMSHPNYNEHLQFIFNLISVCLHNNVKLVLQDFTGYNTDILYSKVLSFFHDIPKQIILSRVCFDMTLGDGNCLPEFLQNMLLCDEEMNFIQEKYHHLTHHIMINSLHYNIILKNRLDLLINEISWKYVKLSESNNFNFRFSNKINFLFHVYNINFDEDNESLDYILPKVKDLITSMIQDIVLAQGCGNDIANHLINILHDRNQFISTMSVLGFE